VTVYADLVMEHFVTSRNVGEPNDAGGPGEARQSVG
jgi:hypothetical protein